MHGHACVHAYKNNNKKKAGFRTTAGKVAERSRKHWLKKYELCYSSCANMIYGIIAGACCSNSPRAGKQIFSDTIQTSYSGFIPVNCGSNKLSVWLKIKLTLLNTECLSNCLLSGPTQSVQFGLIRPDHAATSAKERVYATYFHMYYKINW